MPQTAKPISIAAEILYFKLVTWSFLPKSMMRLKATVAATIAIRIEAKNNLFL